MSEKSLPSAEVLEAIQLSSRAQRRKKHILGEIKVVVESFMENTGAGLSRESPTQIVQVYFILPDKEVGCALVSVKLRI